MRSALLMLIVLGAPAVAGAQSRPARVLPELGPQLLSSLLLGQERAIERCAAETEANAYVASVRARVAPGRAPATLYGARIAVEVVSRPRDRAFERCVRRAVGDALRHARYAVSRAVSAGRTFQIAEPTAPIDRPPPPFDPRAVHRLLAAHRVALQRCLEVAGLPESVTLRVMVRPDGRLVLTSADLPTGAATRALGCLATHISTLRVRGLPARAVTLVHRLPVRGRAR